MAFDFNKGTGIAGATLIAIAISLACFSIAYLLEGFGWSSSYASEGNELYLDIEWNWYRGSGVAFLATILTGISGIVLLVKNRCQCQQGKGSPVLGCLDLNCGKGKIALLMVPTGLIFLFNAIFYRIEAARWFNAGLSPGRVWYLEEASAWYTASWIMSLITIALLATGAILLVLVWKGRK